MKKSSRRLNHASGGSVVLDTSFLIELLDRGREELVDLIAEYEGIIIPWVVAYEYLFGHYLARGPDAAMDRKKLLHEIGVIVEPDQDILIRALELDAGLRGKGRPIPFSDILVAATTSVSGSDLATMDRKHFGGLGIRLIP